MRVLLVFCMASCTRESVLMCTTLAKARQFRCPTLGMLLTLRHSSILPMPGAIKRMSIACLLLLLRTYLQLPRFQVRNDGTITKHRFRLALRERSHQRLTLPCQTGDEVTWVPFVLASVICHLGLTVHFWPLCYLAFSRRGYVRERGP